MRKSIFILLFLCVSFHIVAQNEKIYYDKHWQQTKKRKAKWYRLYTPQDSVYKIEDHYIDGPIYMTGYRTSIVSNSCNYRVGPIIFYDKEGNKIREGQYKKGIRTGTWRYYYKNSDAVHYEYHYTDDTERFDYRLTFDSLSHQLKHKTVNVSTRKTLDWNYTANDSVYYETDYSDSGDTHISTTRYKDHTVIRKENMKGDKSPVVICFNEKGEIIASDTSPNDTAHKIFTYVEQMPRAYKMQDYLKHNLHYPKQARESNIEGRVVIKFIVDEDGAVANPRLLKSIGGGCDEEAIRAISEMPYWEPGLQNGIAVRVIYTLPLLFKLQ